MSDYPLEPIREAVSSLFGRVCLYVLVICVASSIGLSLAYYEIIMPWTGGMWFIGCALLVVFTGGWGLVVYPLLILVLYLYLWKEMDHWVLLIPFLAVGLHMFHIGRMLAE